jgi:UrcA family protein
MAFKPAASYERRIPCSRSKQQLTGDIAMSRLTPHASFRSRALAAAGAITASVMFAATALATAAVPTVRPPQTIVHYGLRDLRTPQGVHTLYERIMSAARRVCPGYDSQDLDAYAYSRACQRQAVAQAVHQIGNRRLAAAYQSTLRGRG